MPLCIGQLGWDITTIGNSVNSAHGGAVLHFCAAAALLGVGCRPIAVVNLEKWKKVFSVLERAGVDCTRLVDTGGEDTAFRLFYDDDLTFLPESFEMIIPAGIQSLEETVLKALPNSELAHLCPMTSQEERHLLCILVDSGVKISFQMHMNNLAQNPKFYREIVQHLDYIFLNLAEARMLTGVSDEVQLIEALKLMSSAVWYVTSPTSVFCVKEEGLIRSKAYSMAVVDPTGAGDAFAGGCTAGRLLLGRENVALRLGILCATAKLTGMSSNAVLESLAGG